VGRHSYERFQLPSLSPYLHRSVLASIKYCKISVIIIIIIMKLHGRRAAAAGARKLAGPGPQVARRGCGPLRAFVRHGTRQGIEL
jgi:hypothetical protein